ncbi:hypothetical protein [Mycobacteroides abscessus]|uniref:hypothetical protein n=1 Tax=Mycobacteroides abscessus TaxID=36809 RepID=UPI0009273402|nr:hypothetical protein [Mycobacteroides abscessus]SHQ46844.1 Uncharacterised protein [Mycobacteroides abscessus subsp. abscessus]SKQ86568.1 Uncharacterised protein [Mycobacteroides abscessus subsp. massiliense]SLC48062.1 Uncharacterised protein [Mycobacteroides abscessus subsp. massiliense]
MSLHILAIDHERNHPWRKSPIEPGEHIYPEDPEQRDHTLICPSLQGCDGWIECLEPHEVDGRSAASGPYRSQDSDPWFRRDEYEFHGVLHTWQSECSGWSVPFDGCIANHSGYELPDDIQDVPIGEYEVEDVWSDGHCTLEFTTDPPTPATTHLDGAPA